MMFFFRNPALICLGALIVFISIAVISGGIENAGMIVSASIVCTLGISLLIWIPLCWVVGWTVFEICSLLFGEERMRRAFRIATADADQTPINLPINNTELLSLVDYIKKCQRQGWSDTQIYSRLKARGWEDEEIEQAQNLANSRREET
ncbi:MAG: hypothetical protein HEQ35_24695 [Gloeotrichia echinulata IR180]|jgi:hypothetical protein